LNATQFCWMDENRLAEGKQTWYKLGMNPIKRASHGAYDLKYRIVWIPKYRKIVLKGHFYALKDVTLKIRKGECVGIVGRNGAGITTLLSLMLGTIFPSKGRLKIMDRVTPFLEPGRGFHADLTG
jgi:ABC-type polysaccharide/polyol phosphate transport system ATPase subunit